MTIPTQDCVCGFIVSMGPLELTAKGVHIVRARVGITDPRTPADHAPGDAPTAGKAYCDLYVYGDAAERVSRRFRKGDTFLAAGRVRLTPSGPVFVAEHIGHDAKQTTYRVVRARHRANPPTRASRTAASETRTRPASEATPTRPAPPTPAPRPPAVPARTAQGGKP